MNKENMELFDQAVDQYGLRARWRDGLFLTTDAERDANEKKMYAEAMGRFESMLASPKSKGSPGYLKWALETSLGIKASRATYRVALNGRSSW